MKWWLGKKRTQEEQEQIDRLESLREDFDRLFHQNEETSDVLQEVTGELKEVARELKSHPEILEGAYHHHPGTPHRGSTDGDSSKSPSPPT